MDILLTMLPGLAVSLELTVFIVVFGTMAGLLLGLAMFAGPRALRWAAWAFSELARGLPTLVTLYLIYFGLPAAGVVLSAFLAIIIGIGITTAGYTAEIYRSAFASVAVGQMDAGRAVGLRSYQIFGLIIIPQVLRATLLPIFGIAILVFQGTSLAYSIGVQELMSIAFTNGTVSFQLTQYLYAAALLYLVIVLIVQALISPKGRETLSAFWRWCLSRVRTREARMQSESNVVA